MLDVKKTIKVLPIHVINPQANTERSIHVGEELESLITTLGGVIVDRVIQKLDNPHNGTYIGRGKVEMVLQRMKEIHVDVVVLNAIAKPRQIHALKTAFQKANPAIEVWDRVDLILQIFDKHAVTTESKLQIQLARMRYMGPRIYGMGFVLSRQGGGIGTSGVGETNTELMKRHWRDEIKSVNDKLEKIAKSKEDQVDARKRSGLKTVSIVGYTNAGKSSLFNKLTKKDVLVENALFATLDSTVGKFYLPQIEQEVLLTDTIGFIRNLPPRLIGAFRSTLMESIHADILLHVIDISDPEYEFKIDVVNDILKDLGRDITDSIYIFNKVDRASKLDREKVLEKYGEHEPLFISIKTDLGIDSVYELLAQRIKQSENTYKE